MLVSTLLRLLLSFFLLFNGCNKEVKTSLIPFNSDNIYYQGRIDTSKNHADLMWSGTSATVRFNGTEVTAILDDEKGANYFNVIIDNDSIRVIHLSEGKKTYTLADGLPFGTHTVKLFKRTEWDKGTTKLYSLSVKGKFLPADKKRKIKIEFYGNSITSGYAVEDYSGKDRPDSIYTNNYNSYSAVTARKLNADYRCISKSGIGIMISWFPLIMPEMYDRLIPNDNTSVWNFKQYTPDIVVINLLQNDSWLIKKPEYSEFIHRFGSTPPGEDFIIKSYKDFVSSIRAHYPDANIICMLGNMDITKKGSPWPGYVSKAVEQLNDNKIMTLFVPYKKTPGHPKVEEQKAMADTLVKFIRKNILTNE
ncbi:MAG: SGNH/GDSL hydrolase family protein [Chlorobi bacterium]|nr:SGNH/GDSL hydrolase family protein [Chlorobiota bacterium]